MAALLRVGPRDGDFGGLAVGGLGLALGALSALWGEAGEEARGDEEEVTPQFRAAALRDRSWRLV
jgi:hypothetical protein